MIFSASKGMYQAVLLGEKTLTTRVNLPAHIAVGKEWAIVPKRASPAWWIGGWQVGNDFDGTPFGDIVITNPRAAIRDRGVIYSVLSAQEQLKHSGFVQARIRIEDFWKTPLGSMTEQEARDEGVASVHEYARLWTAINPDYEWWSHLDFPVYRIRFSLPPEVAHAVARVGERAITEAALAQALEAQS